MRRQLGADHVELDTWEGWARYQLAEPRMLDVARIVNAVERADYTLLGLELRLSGRVVRGPPEDREAGEVLWLEVEGTGQRWEIRGAHADSVSAAYRTRVSDWTEAQVWLEVIARTAAGATIAEEATTDDTP